MVFPAICRSDHPRTLKIESDNSLEPGKFKNSRHSRQNVPFHATGSLPEEGEKLCPKNLFFQLFSLIPLSPVLCPLSSVPKNSPHSRQNVPFHATSCRLFHKLLFSLRFQPLRPLRWIFSLCFCAPTPRHRSYLFEQNAALP